MTCKTFRLLLLLLLLAPQGSHAIPGDQLFFEGFESGVPSGWTKTVGDSSRPTFGVNSAFGYNAGYVAGEEEVRVETPGLDLSGVPGARITLKVIRGDNVVDNSTNPPTVYSNRPDNGENFELEFWGSDDNWHVMVSHSGGDPAGTVFDDVIDLPTGALHAGFKLRFATYGGDPWDGSPDDFWHFDDVKIIETGSASGNLSECTMGANFDTGADGFTLNGAARLSSLTYSSASQSLRLPSNSSNAVGPVLDLSSKTATISAWIRVGGWNGGPDVPESGDHLQFEYLDASNSWQSFQVFCKGCTNSGSVAIDAGGVYAYSANLPSAALHAGFRLRMTNTSTHSSSNLDNWFIDNLCITATSQAHHFAISHDGNGVNCQAEPVVIMAHASDHSVAQNYSGTISLSTSTGHGDWSAAVAIGTLLNYGDGAGSYAFAAADKGQVTLRLANTFVESMGVNVSDGTRAEATSEDDDLTFNEAGFQFVTPGTGLPVGLQIAAKPSATAPANEIELQAIRTSNATGACEAAFIGNTAVDIAMSCETPGTCAGASGVVNGSAVATGNSGTPGSWTTLNLNFGDKNDWSAPVVFTYGDTGRVKLHARKVLTPSGAVMAGSSNTFTVRPFGLDISVDDGSVSSTNPAASDATGTVFERAGNAFRVTARAVAWQNSDDSDSDGIPDGHSDADASNNANLSDNPSVTNFAVEASPDSVSLTATLVAPVGGNDPGLTGTTTMNGFLGGASSSNDIAWGEAGIIEIAAALADDDYLGAGAVHGRSGHVGRFTPAWFESTTISHGCNNTLAFSYSGQPLQGLRFTARNAAGVTTQNYDGGLNYAKDVTITEASGLTGSVLNGAIAAEDFSNGVATITATPAGIGFTFSNKESAPATAIFRAVDSDSVSSSGHTEAQTQVRSARLAMTTVYSSLIADARSPLMIETFNVGEWRHESNDTCSTLNTAAFVLGPYSGSGNPLINSNPAATFLSGGAGQFVMTTPGGGDEGSRLVTYPASDWLEFDWNGNGDESPSATITFFNLFSSEDGMIDVHEVFP